VIETKYNGVTKFTYTYNGNGQLYSMTDAINSTTTCYEYDSIGRLIRAREMSGTTKKLGVQNLYDSLGRPSSSVYDIEGFTETYAINYKANSNLISSFTLNRDSVTTTKSYTYDKFDRLYQTTLDHGAARILLKGYSYLDGATSAKTTTLVNSEIFNDVSTVYSYEYDAVGNITNVKFNGVSKSSYEYDALNQLTRENNAYANQSCTYEYDDAGNILYKRTYAYTTGTLGLVQSTISYGYNNANWGDLLTSYAGSAITYDAIGNPTNWKNIAGLQWQGRNLTYASLDGLDYGISYTYNADGIRTRKYAWLPSGNTDFNYILDGSKILKETRTGAQNATLYYYYDDAGSITGFTYNNVDYYFGKNIQGDVKYIYDTTGAVVVEYAYDAWGNILSTTGSLASTIGVINPFRYRSYYYDSETGVYHS